VLGGGGNILAQKIKQVLTAIHQGGIVKEDHKDQAIARKRYEKMQENIIYFFATIGIVTLIIIASALAGS